MSKDEMQLLVEEVNKRMASGDEDTMDVCVELSIREGLSEKETRLLLDLSFSEKLNQVKRRRGYLLG